MAAQGLDAATVANQNCIIDQFIARCRKSGEFRKRLAPNFLVCRNARTVYQRCTGSGFQDSSPAGFSTFSTNRIGTGVRLFSSFRIRIKIFKFHLFWYLTPTQS